MKNRILAILFSILLFATKPARATVNADLIRQFTTGNAVTTAFPFTFKYASASDVNVYVNGVLKTASVDYTESAATSGDGGTINFISAPANGAVILITRAAPYTQTTHFSTVGAITSTALERAYDKLAMQVQQLADAQARAITLPVTDQSGSPATLPLAVADGGTASATPSAARTALGLAIGTNVQAYNSNLTTWAGKTAPGGTVLGTNDSQTLTNKAIDCNSNTCTNFPGGGGGVGTVTSVALSGGTTGITTSGGPITTTGTITLAGTLATANGGTGSATTSGARTALGLAIGTNVEAWDADLDTLAGKTIPSGGTLADTSSAQTFTTKTLTSPIISTISNSGTLTLPTSSDTLVGRATTDTLTNKSIDCNTNTCTNFPNSGGAGAPTDATYITQNHNGTLSAEQALSDLSTGLAKVTTSTGVISTVAAPTGTVVGTSDSQTLTNKTLTAPIIATISNSGTLTLPTSSDTLVGRATTDTLTNKTLTAPIIATISNTGTVTLPTATDTLVARATTDTLTNKTIDCNSNTCTNFPSASSGALIFISKQTASSSPTIDFTSGIDSTYDHYILVMNNVLVSTTARIYMRVSEDAGLTWKSGASDYQYGSSESGGAITQTTAAQIALDQGDTIVTTFTNTRVAGHVDLFNPADTGVYKPFRTDMMGAASSVIYTTFNGMGLYKGSTNAVNGLRLLPSTGSFTSGTFILYGVKHS